MVIMEVAMVEVEGSKLPEVGTGPNNSYHDQTLENFSVFLLHPHDNEPWKHAIDG